LIAALWPLVFLVAVVLGFVAWERHAIRTRARTSVDTRAELEDLRKTLQTFGAEVVRLGAQSVTFDQILNNPSTGLVERVRRLQNASSLK
jgi:uncharacterized membrane-anchored protein YhcB (DUF1043 family)